MVFILILADSRCVNFATSYLCYVLEYCVLLILL